MGLGSSLGRIGRGIATGGLSEVARGIGVGNLSRGQAAITSGGLSELLGFGEDISSLNQRRESQGLPPLQQEQITAANVFKRLTPEQQKDILINNPNIVTALGEQRFDPLTNTITLTESPFTQSQRERQEALAAGLSGSLTGELPTIDTEAVTQATFQQGKELLEPEFQLQRRRLEQQLADQGIPRGSEAFNESLDRLERSQGSQLRQLSLASVGQGIQTAEAQRAARFNEISALLGQQQVGGIGFSQFQPQASGLDLFGAEQAGLNRAFQGEQLRKQRSQQRREALIGALGQLGGAGISALSLSDARIKKNITKIGKSDSGISIFEFDYINPDLGSGRYQGVMAQDVKDIMPEAIFTFEDGVMAVNYDLIDVDFRRVN